MFDGNDLPHELLLTTRQKIVHALRDSNILLKGATKTITNKTKEQKRGFSGMLLGTLGASLLGNMLAGKIIVRPGSGNEKGKRIVRAGSGNKERKRIVTVGYGNAMAF